MENQQANPSAGTTQQQPPKIQSDGDEPGIADFYAILTERRRELGVEEPRDPSTTAEIVRKLPPLPPPITPEEAEALQRKEAEAALRRQRQDRESRWNAIAAARGERYANCTLADFQVQHPAQGKALESIRQYAADLEYRCKSGEGVVLYGPVGTGKDHLLAALMRIAVIKHGLNVRWKNGMDMFGEIRDRMDSGDPEAAWVTSQVYPDVLVISDPLPPKGELTSHQSAMLFRCIDARYSRRKPTWVSFNAQDRGDAETRMGVSLVDRLSHGALVVFANWPSYRTPK